MPFLYNTKDLNQHILIDQEIINFWLRNSNLNKDDIVVEIGPGKGNITSLIAPKVAKLYCIELDERLKPDLFKLKEDNPNIELVFGSALDVFIPKCDKIITSLPFSIIEPFIAKLIRCEFNEAIMIVGSKFANSVINKELTYLSLLTNSFFKTEKLLEIMPDAFLPKPRVMSMMIRLIPLEEREIKDLTELIFRLMFKYPSQKIKNALMESLIKAKAYQGEVLTKKMSKERLKALDIPNDILEKKFEVCTNEELKILYNEIIKLN